MKLKDLKKKLLSNSDVRKEYEKRDLPFEIAREVIRERMNQGLTQTKLAELAGTKQSAIARLESGDHYPSTSLLEKIADALQIQLVVRLGTEIGSAESIASPSSDTMDLVSMSESAWPSEALNPMGRSDSPLLR